MCGRAFDFRDDTVMVYVITHRAKDGSVAQESVVADSRKDALDQVKARGAVLSCKESLTGKSKQGSLQLSSRYVKWSIFAIVVAVTGILAFLFVGDETEEKPLVPQPKKIRTVKVPQQVTHRVKTTTTVEPEPIDTNLLKRIKHVKHPVTGADMVITQKVVELLPNAGIIGKVYTNNVIKPPKKLFKTFSENYIVGLMRAEPGMPVVGMRLPKNFDEEIKAHIAEPINILPDDTEEDIELKRRMQEIKKTMAGLIADGRTPSEVIMEERKEMNRLARMRTNAMKDLADFRRKGATREEIANYVEAANKLMDEYGAKHIKMPLEKIQKITVEK